MELAFLFVFGYLLGGITVGLLEMISKRTK